MSGSGGLIGFPSIGKILAGLPPIYHRGATLECSAVPPVANQPDSGC